ncbi:hypothetical protein HELRODRAFT_176677 [Helobdella robusta]|uniref:Uncharacterized protein n=1 Tax=Helobdella robusta TaxID=6412 RepID=T1FAS2_HELRO|nr:hypothetical protein HELRODRAFT_176677 [Helobdella robusta]ESN99515.1 hypothetical protein HELRODRAFT_176677 [Helobdella robusta]
MSTLLNKRRGYKLYHIISCVSEVSNLINVLAQSAGVPCFELLLRDCMAAWFETQKQSYACDTVPMDSSQVFDYHRYLMVLLRKGWENGQSERPLTEVILKF